MTASVVVMILIGICFVIASYFVSEKLTKDENGQKVDLMTVDEDYEFSDRERQIIKSKIEDVIANHAKDIIYDTNESLSNMANEKTMALGDYAVAVCDEIEKNHKEVMFLYSMLEDKRKEIMQTVKDVDAAKSEVKELVTKIGEERVENHVNDNYQFVDTGFNEIPVNDNISAVNNETTVQNVYTANTKPDDNNDALDGSINEEDIMDSELNDIFSEIDNTDIDFDEVLEKDFSDDSNANDIILEMYRGGSSVIDIAKQLGLGVGEVKLVIDLYQGE